MTSGDEFAGRYFRHFVIVVLVSFMIVSFFQ
jgi:hypothetical protein